MPPASDQDRVMLKQTICVKHPGFLHMHWVDPHLRTHVDTEEAAENTHTERPEADRLERKPSPSSPMSGTDLGQSWLMCPQFPRGFWSGGSDACSLSMNTNALDDWTPTVFCTVNGVTGISLKTLWTEDICIRTPNSSLWQLLCQHWRLLHVYVYCTCVWALSLLAFILKPWMDMLSCVWIRGCFYPPNVTVFMELCRP